ncbi:MAG: methionine--tRNA ligase [Candidatus Colwellbacteria bacterium]|jgi:methionyl-tRNA synthetase|nr:methionine--tRNA ligase [Candidatus Colwellbacteria bacterium]MCK9497615.1 methionine--tRNA ligase [Candidatus Colwellbacteria bacterium]MDD3752495.1 methionine--tRNA ligase [Candidatus Colwellbacteria bacterium]MDD4818896.1 methionine--tRNA ligase [Candidatus Colwellbacteria bacterium]
MPKKGNFYITTSIAYANGRPHIGHALEAVQADAIARYKRGLGYNVLFLTGTDEHGDKINRIALQSGKTAKDFVGEISKEFKRLKKTLNLSWSDFIRTSDKKNHWPGAKKLFAELEKKGDIYKKEYEGFYCVGCEKFITEKELVNGQCPLHKKEPEKVSEENYFFRLSRYADRVAHAIRTGEIEIVPESRKNETLSFIKEGLEDVSFSRSEKTVPWGIPVPNSDQTMYVWCDALSNYITAIGYGRDAKSFKKWWPANVHLIGKDIFRFHAIYWPAMLMSAGLSLPKRLLVHGFITVEGNKMSKSIGNVIDPFEIADKFGADALRHYLLREIPSDGDGDFSWEKLKSRYNDDLAKGVGNFASRITNLLKGEKINKRSPISKEVRDEIKRMQARVEKHINEFRLHDAVSAIFDLIKFGDSYVNEKEPWKNKTKKISRDLAALIIAVGEGLQPFLPDAADKIMKAVPEKRGYILPKKIKPLFPRMDN